MAERRVHTPEVTGSTPVPATTSSHHGIKVMSQEIEIQFDDETGDYIICIPDDIVDSLGLNENDELSWTVRDDGSIILARKTP